MTDVLRKLLIDIRDYFDDIASDEAVNPFEFRYAVNILERINSILEPKETGHEE